VLALPRAGFRRAEFIGTRACGIEPSLTANGWQDWAMLTKTPFDAGESEALRTSLQRHRELMLWKIEGVDDDALRRPMVPSGTTLLGLIKHLACVEYLWFCITFGRETEPLPFADDDSEDDDADSRIEPDETTDDIIAFYHRSWSAADRVIAEVGLDDTGTAWFGDAVSMRWVLIHMIEETARHAGHADIVRELIDGTTGYKPEA
jgi:Protein of unknown function (DUF664)